ncbi:MAG: tripartite tricarboxylate transporter TctB family protein [Pseudomonadota bacterium]
MTHGDDTMTLRARDFWTSLVLIAVSLFFLWKTSKIPLFGANRAGVSGADWYNSAAIVPLGIFAAMLILSLVLLINAIRSGGAAQAFEAAGIGWNQDEALRFSTIGLILLAYIGGLVPRVDFILCSGLLITALIFGYHGGHRNRMVIAATVVVCAGLYAGAAHLPQSQWNAHDDDWVTLAAWGLLSVIMMWQARHEKLTRIVPVIAVLAPLILVCAMAFGFRQNVPARGGLIFKQIEYHYYVTLKPIWSR